MHSGRLDTNNLKLISEGIALHISNKQNYIGFLIDEIRKSLTLLGCTLFILQSCFDVKLHTGSPD